MESTDPVKISHNTKQKLQSPINLLHQPPNVRRKAKNIWWLNTNLYYKIRIQPDQYYFQVHMSYISYLFQYFMIIEPSKYRRHVTIYVHHLHQICFLLLQSVQKVGLHRLVSLKILKPLEQLVVQERSFQIEDKGGRC